MEAVAEEDGLQIRYIDEGEGRPIIILHGWRSSAETWRGVTEELVSRGYRVIVPDLPGFGATPPPPEDWTAREYASVPGRVAKAAGIDRFLLVGHSFGGKLAVQYEADGGEGVEGLVLNNAAALMRKRTRHTVALAAAKGGGKAAQLPLLSRFREPVRRSFYGLLGREEYMEADERMRQVFLDILGADMRHRISEISSPTLVIWSEGDTVIPIKEGKKIFGKLRNAQWRVIPAAGHSSHLEAPEEVAEAIDTFYQQL